MDLVKSLLAFALLTTTIACTPDMGDAQPWVPIEEMAGPLSPEYVAATMPATARGAQPGLLRVVTYNVLRGENVDGLASAFDDNDALRQADLVLLQEIEDHPGEGGSRAARLAAKLGMGFVYAPERFEGDGTHGIAILSVYPLSHVAVMQLPQVDLPWSERQRIALAADVQVGDQIFRVINTHLDTRLSIPQRILQLRPAIIDAPERAIVGGDFNTNPYMWVDGSIPQVPTQTVTGTDQAAQFDDYMRHLGFATPTAGSGPTQHTPVLDSRLDSIFVRDFAASPGKVEREIDLSDHWPLWIDVSE
jgi:endonuclease/exonuclease/phosphatase family metal-dependent hydrolase